MGKSQIQEFDCGKLIRSRSWVWLGTNFCASNEPKKILMILGNFCSETPIRRETQKFPLRNLQEFLGVSELAQKLVPNHTSRTLL